MQHIFPVLYIWSNSVLEQDKLVWILGLKTYYQLSLNEKLVILKYNTWK